MEPTRTHSEKYLHYNSYYVTVHKNNVIRLLLEIYGTKNFAKF